ncbi:MbtH family NRPS accessory protein [Streptomyces sp. PmtG]
MDLQRHRGDSVRAGSDEHLTNRPFDDGNGRFIVLANDEGQHSPRLVYAAVPSSLTGTTVTNPPHSAPLVPGGETRRGPR